MEIREGITQIMCGIALILVCMINIIVSVPYGNGDITPALILFPMGVCSMISGCEIFYKHENKS